MRNSGRFSRIYRSKLRDFCTANYFVLSCSWFLLFCFFLFSLLNWVAHTYIRLHFLCLRPTKYRVHSTVGFFSGMHNAIATASVFLERFFTSPLSSHDVMSKLFWVENKVMLEKCSVCKQPNRIGNSTELSRGEEFLPRGCDFTTTWNLWSPNIKRVSRNLPRTKFLPRSLRDLVEILGSILAAELFGSRRDLAEIPKSRRPKSCRDL